MTSWWLNVAHAEQLLHDAKQSMDTAGSQREWERVQIQIQMAQVYATLAIAELTNDQ